MKKFKDVLMDYLIVYLFVISSLTVTISFYILVAMLFGESFEGGCS